MIDFTTVSREFRSVVSRRRELLTFLGTVFAALGIFLQNVLQDNLPDSLRNLKDHVFAFYAVMLLVPSLVLALRNAKLHSGMVLNGILYARLMQEQTFTSRKGDPQRAAQHNFFGVSFLMFLLTDLIAGFSAVLLAVALALPWWAAVLAGAGVFVLWFFLYLHFHRQAAAFALAKIATDQCKPFDENEWQDHVAGSLEDVNNDMISVLAFVGLIAFSVFEGLSGWKRLAGNTELDPRAVQEFGPIVLGLLLVVTCFVGMLTYVRLRVAVGNFSLQIDPTDQPFRPLRLTDSFLGYVLLAFLFGISWYVLLYMVAPGLGEVLLLIISGLAFLAAIAMEQLTVYFAGKAAGPPRPPTPDREKTNYAEDSAAGRKSP
jgi:hypothetical protein